MNLAECKVGETVKIESLHLNESQQRRFMEMGILPGTFVEIVRTAPLKDPICVKLRGFQVTFRKKEAEKITISQ